MPRPPWFRAIFLISVLMSGGCNVTPPDPREDRIRRELGFARPYRLLEAGFAADGGSGLVHFTDARGESLWILVDGRMTIQKSDADTIPPARYVHLARRLDYDGSRRLDYDSPAESAVVDLLSLTMHELAQGRESTLVRDWRRLEADTTAADTFRDWRFSLPEREQQALRLSRMIETIERRRSEARSGRGTAP